MKVAKKEEVKQVTESWPEVREQFVDLEEANLSMKLAGSVLVCSKELRPYLSRAAKAEGIKYFTLGLPGDRMLVVRHRSLKKLAKA